MVGRPDTADRRTADLDASNSTARLAFVALLVAAAVLRFVDIGSQLWLDEISTLTGSVQRPFSQIATRWPGAASHVAYELTARVGLLTFGLPAGIRLPAVLFGIAGVAIVAAFARRAFGTGRALVIAGLFTFNYHHVFFSQSAAGYTLLIAAYLSTLLAFTVGAQRETPGRGVLAAYALSGAIAAYSQPIGCFILAGQAVVILALAWNARRRGKPSPVPFEFFWAAVAGGVLAILAYLPFVPGMVRYTKMNASTAAEGPRIGMSLVREVVDGLSAAFHGPVGLALVAAFGLIGIVAWWRRHPLSLYAAFAPILAEAVGVIAAGIGIHPRYFAVALPVLLILAGLGLYEIVTALVKRVIAQPATQSRATAGILAAAVLLSAYPLVDYYRHPKQDFLGTIEYLKQRRDACPVTVAIGNAGHILDWYYHSGIADVDTLSQLQRVEAKSEKMCVVTTLETLLRVSHPEIVDHLRAGYTRDTVLQGTVGDAGMRIYERKTQ